MTAAPVIAAPPASVRVTLPLRLDNPLNGAQGRHWAARARKRKVVRDQVCLVVGAHLRGAGLDLDAGLVVTLIRIAPSSGLDDDSLPASCKSVRDGVADALLVNDRDPRLSWRYEARRGQRRGSAALGLADGYGVEVRIERRVR